MTDTPDKAVILAVDDTPENLDVVKGILASLVGNDHVVLAVDIDKTIAPISAGAAV